MDKSIRLLILLGVVILLSSCTFESPISKAGNVPADKRLYGLWANTASNVAIYPYGRDRYTIILNAGTHSETKFIAHGSLVAKKVFINLEIIKSKNTLLHSLRRRFLFLTYTFSSPNAIVIRFINPSLIPKGMKSSKEISAIIERNINSSIFFQKDSIIFHRTQRKMTNPWQAKSVTANVTSSNPVTE